MPILGERDGGGGDGGGDGGGGSSSSPRVGRSPAHQLASASACRPSRQRADEQERRRRRRRRWRQRRQKRLLLFLWCEAPTRHVKMLPLYTRAASPTLAYAHNERASERKFIIGKFFSSSSLLCNLARALERARLHAAAALQMRIKNRLARAYEATARKFSRRAKRSALNLKRFWRPPRLSSQLGGSFERRRAATASGERRRRRAAATSGGDERRRLRLKCRSLSAAPRGGGDKNRNADRPYCVRARARALASSARSHLPLQSKRASGAFRVSLPFDSGERRQTKRAKPLKRRR